MVVAFLGFVLDEDRFELRRGGKPVHLEPKVFDLLAYLIRRREHVVSRDELLKALWGRIVSESGITRCVSLARAALDDDPSRARAIVTVHGRGYRFVAPVEELPQRTVVPAPRGGGARSNRGFVGRERELSVLAGDLEAAHAGMGRLGLLTGEAGIGKTRTLEELADRARSAGAQVFVARCHRAEGAPPFWPWVQVLRELFAHKPPRDARRLLEAEAPDVLHLLPELRDRLEGSALPSRLRTPKARFLLFESVVRALRAAARACPVVVCIDDLHDADLASLHLFHFLAGEIAETRLLLVAAYREPELHAVPEARTLVADCLRRAGARMIALEGLSLADLETLVGAARAPAGEPALARALHERTGGNPLFVGQLLDALRARGAGDADGERVIRGEPPRSVREVIRGRLERLPAASVELLEHASVLGTQFRVDVLARLAERTPAEVTGALVSAREAGIILPGADPLELRFRHSLVRDTLHDGLSPLRRAELHDRVVRVLEARRPAGRATRSEVPVVHESSSEIALHAYEAVAVAGTAQAVLRAWRAATASSARLAYEEAVFHLSRALELVTSDPETSAERCELWIALGDAQTRAGDRDGARTSLERAAAIAREVGSPERLAQAALVLDPGFFAIEVGVSDPDLIGLLEDALDAVGDARTPLRARLLSRLATADRYAPRADCLLADGTALARELGDPRAILTALLSQLVSGPDDPRERLAQATEMLDLARRAGDPESALVARVVRVTSYLTLGRDSDADREIVAFTRAAERLRLPQALWYARMFPATRALRDGRFDAAERLGRDFAEVGARVHDANALHSFGAMLALMRWEQDRLDELFDGIERFAREHPEVLVWRCALAMAHVELGRPEEAAIELELIGHDAFKPYADQPHAWSGSVLLCEVCERLGDDVHARALYEQLLPARGHCIYTGFGGACFGAASRQLGILARTFRDLDAAEEHLDDALALEQRVGARTWLVHTRFHRSRVFHQQGRVDEARVEGAEALRLARRLGMPRMERRLREHEPSTGPASAVLLNS